MNKRKSPYLLLGVPYGASKNEAARAFARATRRLRRLSDPPYDLEDPNWALHAIEQRIQDPATSVDDFRMPADGSVYDIPNGVGILNPPVAPYRRRTPPSNSTDLEALRIGVLLEVADEIAAECRNSPLPALHHFPGGDVANGLTISTLHESDSASSTTASPPTGWRHRSGWSTAIAILAAVLAAAAIVVAVTLGVIAASDSSSVDEVATSSPPVAVTPATDDPAAMVFDAQLATDERAFSVCEDSCWIWDITPSESCEEAEIEIGMYLSADSIEPTVTRTQPLGRLAAGVVTRVVVPAEPDDPEFAELHRLACDK